MRDVAVIGAGPAGLTAARALAARGTRCRRARGTLRHRRAGALHRRPRRRRLLRIRPSAATILATAHAATFVAADGSAVSVDAERVERGGRRSRAVRSGRSAESSRAGRRGAASGARVRTIAVGDVERHDRRGRRSGDVEARACVLACGANYRFNRQLGLGVPRAFVQSAQLEQPFDGPDGVEVHLGREVAPGGFAWLVPFERDGRPHARLGLMCRLARARRASGSSRRGCAPGSMPAASWPEPRLKILPLGPVSRTYGTRLLAVGDAAGLVKPTTGGGIYYSLISGQYRRRDARRSAGARTICARRGCAATRPSGARGSAPRSASASRSARWPRASTIAPSTPSSSSRAWTASSRCCRETADFNWHRQSALALLRARAVPQDPARVALELSARFRTFPHLSTLAPTPK